MSQHKGESCVSKYDCPSTIEGVYAECRCGLNANGTKLCDILEGDTEWEDARTKVKHLLV
jgi:hypothetical protein